MNTNDDSPRVFRDDSRGRFEITVEGKTAGFTYFVTAGLPGDAERIFYHTEIAESFSGQGLASKLVGEAMDDSADAATSVVAVCPYVKRWLDSHPEHPVGRTATTPTHLSLIPRA
ncbi:GNAT family N-acetyltransferase [Nesterenkonia suensis]